MANKRVVTGTIFFAVLAAFLIGSVWLPYLIVIYLTAAAGLSAVEISHALRNKFRPFSQTAVFIGALTMLSSLIVWIAYKDLRHWHILRKEELPLDINWATDFIWLTACGVLIYFLIFLSLSFLNVIFKLIRKGPEHLPHAVAEAAAGFYISAPFSAAVLFQFAVPHGYFWLLFALLTPMVVDVAAYYSGSLLGRKKMLPQISPNKSWVGFFGGILASVIFSAAFFMIVFSGEAPKLPLKTALIFGLIAGLLLGVIAQFGDWTASSVKRWCGIKDFSNLLPGHGGILDRFDSILFSLPASLILALVFYLLKRGA